MGPALSADLPSSSLMTSSRTELVTRGAPGPARESGPEEEVFPRSGCALYWGAPLGPVRLTFPAIKLVHDRLDEIVAHERDALYQGLHRGLLQLEALAGELARDGL